MPSETAPLASGGEPGHRVDARPYIDEGASHVRAHDAAHLPTYGISRPSGAGPRPALARPQIESLEARLVLSSSPTPYLQTNLVSDVPGLAQLQDSSLVNSWGVSFSTTTGTVWVSNQGTNTSTLYSVTPTTVSKVSLNGPGVNTVNIPTTASGPQGPTGQVSNGTSSFLVNGMPRTSSSPT